MTKVSKLRSKETIRIPVAHIAHLIEQDLRTRKKYKDAMVVPNGLRFKRTGDEINKYPVEEVIVMLDNSIE